MKDQHLHNCILCEKKFKCMTTYTHAGDNTQEVYDCRGTIDSFCDNHTIDEIYKWHTDRGEFDNILPLSSEIEALYKKYCIFVEDGKI